MVSNKPLKTICFLVLVFLAIAFPCFVHADTLDNWTFSDSGTSRNLYGIAYGNGILVAAGGADSASTILTSDDGVTWTWHISGVLGPLYGVAYGNGIFVAVGRDYDADVGAILTSDDGGATWTSRTSGVTQTLYAVAYDETDARFVAVGAGGTILTSDDDGVTWTERTSETSAILYGVSYGNSTFVVVGSGGTVLTSDDAGVTWRTRVSGTTANLRGTTFGNSTFVAVGLGGTILTSDDDGVTWTPRTSGTTSMLARVSLCNGTFVAVGSTGVIRTSVNGVTWTARTSGTSDILWDVTYGNGMFAAPGSNGIILIADIGTVLINSGASYTSSTSASLTLSCDDSTIGGCLQMQFSNDNTSWSSPEAYTTSKSWTLASGADGTRHVFAKFQDSASDWSAAFYDTIIMETVPPGVSASPATGTYYSVQSVTLTCNDGTGSGCYRIYYTTDGSTPDAGSAVYTGPISISANTTLKFFAMDNAGNSSGVSTETYTIIIYPPLTVSTFSIPSGMLGTAYSQTLAASGGLPPYSWSLYTGSLPNGLNLSSAGVISGTPTAAATFNFTVQVTDSLSSTATRAFSIVIGSYPVRISGAPPAYFSGIQSSYSSAANNDIIQIQASTLTENLNFNKDIVVTLEGGYDVNFTDNLSNTAVVGTMTVTQGTVIIERLTLTQ